MSKSKPKPELDTAKLAEHAEEIRQLSKRTIADIIEIGNHLIACKELLGHGNWGSWLESEFAWSESTALNFMRVAELNESVPVTDLPIDAKALYLIARPSVASEARDEVIERAASGEKVSSAEARRVVRARKADDESLAALQLLWNASSRKVKQEFARANIIEITELAEKHRVSSAVDRAVSRAERRDGTKH